MAAMRYLLCSPVETRSPRSRSEKSFRPPSTQSDKSSSSGASTRLWLISRSIPVPLPRMTKSIRTSGVFPNLYLNSVRGGCRSNSSECSVNGHGRLSSIGKVLHICRASNSDRLKTSEDCKFRGKSNVIIGRCSKLRGVATQSGSGQVDSAMS